MKLHHQHRSSLDYSWGGAGSVSATSAAASARTEADTLPVPPMNSLGYAFPFGTSKFASLSMIVITALVSLSVSPAARAAC